MIEKLAARLWGAYMDEPNYEGTWEDLPDDERTDWQLVAQAALAALTVQPEKKDLRALAEELRTHAMQKEGFDDLGPMAQEVWLRAADFVVQRDAARLESWRWFIEHSGLWFINRNLHLLGLAIVLIEDEESGRYLDIRPEAVPFRGFSEEVEEAGFRGITSLMHKNLGSILFDARVTEPEAPFAWVEVEAARLGQVEEGCRGFVLPTPDGKQYVAEIITSATEVPLSYSILLPDGTHPVFEIQGKVPSFAHLKQRCEEAACRHGFWPVRVRAD